MCFNWASYYQKSQKQKTAQASIKLFLRNQKQVQSHRHTIRDVKRRTVQRKCLYWFPSNAVVIFASSTHVLRRESTCTYLCCHGSVGCKMNCGQTLQVNFIMFFIMCHSSAIYLPQQCIAILKGMGDGTLKRINSTPCTFEHRLWPLNAFALQTI